MSIFYNPKTKKTNILVIAIFIIIPIAIVVMLMQFSKTMVKEHKVKKDVSDKYDVFEDLDKKK